MRTKILFLVLIISTVAISEVKAQGLNNAQDFGAGIVMMNNHRTQFNRFGGWRNQEIISTAQFREARNRLQELEELQRRINSRLGNWQARVGDVRIINGFREISGDIGRLQVEMIGMAREMPELLTMAWEVEMKMIRRTNHLMNTIYGAVINPVALMDDAQRRRLLRHIDHELREMRGMAQNIVHQMRFAQRNGISNNIFVGYDSERAAIAQEVINNIRFRFD